jgi:hypothetical protein
VIEEMAERDVTKFDAITKTRASTIFTHLTYAMDYANSIQQKLT